LAHGARPCAPSLDRTPDTDDPDAPPVQAPTFCLESQTLPAAEQFLHARYTLTNRSISIRSSVASSTWSPSCFEGSLGIPPAKTLSIKPCYPPATPVLTFFLNDDLESYLQLDDAVLWGGIQSMTLAKNEAIRTMATRLRGRRLYKTLDIARWGADVDKQAQHIR
jgi:hypothetical protein